MPPGHGLISKNLRGIFPYDLLVMEASSNPKMIQAMDIAIVSGCLP